MAWGLIWPSQIRDLFCLVWFIVRPAGGRACLPRPTRSIARESTRTLGRVVDSRVTCSRSAGAGVKSPDDERRGLPRECATPLVWQRLPAFREAATTRTRRLVGVDGQPLAAPSPARWCVSSVILAQSCERRSCDVDRRLFGGRGRRRATANRTGLTRPGGRTNNTTHSTFTRQRNIVSPYTPPASRTLFPIKSDTSASPLRTAAVLLCVLLLDRAARRFEEQEDRSSKYIRSDHNSCARKKARQKATRFPE